MANRLHRLVSWLPFGWVRHIPRGVNREYMDRYSLRRQATSGSNPWRVYVNHFLAPDEPGHHDHPSKWSFSLILWGSYTEEILEPAWYPVGDSMGPWEPGFGSIRTRRVRWFNWIPAGRYHRISELHPSRFGGRGVVTLFMCGPLRRDAEGRPIKWGFWIPGRGHVPKEQLDAERASQN